MTGDDEWVFPPNGKGLDRYRRITGYDVLIDKETKVPITLTMCSF
jgi:hypothetical protein